MDETTSAVKICSNALLMLGAQPIASFSEGSGFGANLDRAKLCSELYPQTRKAVLRGHYWNCCVKRVMLSPDVIPPPFGFANRFLLPGDWLRTVNVGDERGRSRIIYRSEGRYLLSDEVVFPLTYLADTPEQEWDTLLIDVMTMAMAWRMAYPITKSTSVEDQRNGELKELLKQARAVDGQDDPPETLGDSPLLQSRFTGIGGF